MRKTFLLLMTMVLCCVIAQAQPSGLNNRTVYTIQSVNRGYFYYDANNAGYITSSSHTTITNASPTGATNEQFAFLRVDGMNSGEYYMWSVGAQKFVTSSGSDVGLHLSDTPASTVKFESNSGRFVLKIATGEKQDQSINITNWAAKYGCKVISTAPDDGNRMDLVARNTNADLTIAIDKILLSKATHVTELSGLSNNKVYIISNARSTNTGLYYDSNNASKVSWDGWYDGRKLSFSNSAYHWAIYKSSYTKKYYFYNIAAQKFIGKQTAADGEMPFVSAPDYSATIEKKAQNTSYPFFMTANENNGVINTTANHDRFGSTAGLINWNGGWNETGDAGNSFAFIEAGTIDKSLLATIERAVNIYEGVAPEFESGKLYRIKNRNTNLAISTTADGQGAYLSSTKGKNIERWDTQERWIDCNTTSLADAGCVWKFIENSEGKWMIQNVNNGMYIATSRAGSNSLYVQFTNENSSNVAHFTIEKNSNGYFTFTDNSYNCAGGNSLHASSGGLQVWAASAAASQWQIIPATELEVTLNAGKTEEDESSNAYWASLHLPFAVAMPDGVTANKASISAEAGTVTLEPMSGEIPANTGMILRAASATNATLTILSESEISNLADVENNALSGTNVEIALDGTNNAEYYVLGKGKTNGRVGLRNPSSSVTKIPMNRAYYHTTNPQMNMLMFVLGEATGIDNVKEATMNNTGDIYDLSGRKVLQPLKGGIYIQNGKKFIKR